ncbi:MAG TPA: GatB/YqeY domain-containing protein, partial [Candidatus Saccharimonadales bacterium]|nr:GatB/YqeY domain-containing protein [Candidatus Saccharimonadales bacterium]
KAALLAGDKFKVDTLRLLKSVLLNYKVANGTRDRAMTDDEVINLFSKEAKKRQESADLYVQGGSQEKADKELAEKQLIDEYLPAQLSDDELRALVDEAVAAAGDNPNMGQLIGQVKAKAGAGADGGRIAVLVRERLGQ